MMALTRRQIIGQYTGTAARPPTFQPQFRSHSPPSSLQTRHVLRKNLHTSKVGNRSPAALESFPHPTAGIVASTTMIPPSLQTRKRTWDMASLRLQGTGNNI